MTLTRTMTLRKRGHSRHGQERHEAAQEQELVGHQQQAKILHVELEYFQILLSELRIFFVCFLPNQMIVIADIVDNIRHSKSSSVKLKLTGAVKFKLLYVPFCQPCDEIRTCSGCTPPVAHCQLRSTPVPHSQGCTISFEHHHSDVRVRDSHIAGPAMHEANELN